MPDSNIISPMELRDLFMQEAYQPEIKSDEINIDNDFIYNNDSIGTYRSSLVLDHLLVESMFTDLKKVNWETVTDLYTFPKIIEVLRIWLHPLTWLPIDRQITNKYIVVGKIAAEKLCDSRLNDECFEQLFEELLTLRLYAFAEYDVCVEADATIEDDKKVLKYMRLWHYITEDVSTVMDELIVTGEHKYAETVPFDSDTFISNIKTIASKISQARAAQLISELRNDWKHITQLKLFGIDKCSEEQVARFEYALFREIEPDFLEWKQNADDQTTERTYETKQRNGNKKPTEAELMEIFTYSYYITGNCRRLIDFLIDERDRVTDSEWLRHAHEIYMAKDFIKITSNTFKGWLKNFCRIFGRTVEYKYPSDIQRTRSTNSLQSYLHYDIHHDSL